MSQSNNFCGCFKDGGINYDWEIIRTTEVPGSDVCARHGH